jgi:TusA-related sulfurtransferase
MTWVKTRVALERLSQGEELEVLLAEGEPARSVPESAAEDGHRVVALVELGEGQGVRLVIAKQERGGEPWR